MPYSINQYTGNGAQTTFVVSYPFITRDHVAVTVAGIPVTPAWLSDGLILLAPAPANGALVSIARNSSRGSKLVDFQDAQVLTEASLDLANTQAIYIAQEAFDSSNVSTVSSQVAADAAAAAASAAAAATSATNAATSASGASTSASNAGTQAAAAAASAVAAAASAAAALVSANNAAATLANALVKTNNLSDVSNVATSRTNLGLGTAAQQANAFFAQTSLNLSDLANAGTARTNLGLGTAATQANSFFAQTSLNLSDLAAPATARANLAVVALAGDTMTGNLILTRTASGDRFTEWRNSVANTNGGRWAWEHVKTGADDYLALMPVTDAGADTTAAIKIQRTGSTMKNIIITPRTCHGGVTDDGSSDLQCNNLKVNVALLMNADLILGAGLNLDLQAANGVFNPAEIDDGNSGATKTIAFVGASAFHKVAMTGSCTFTFTFAGTTKTGVYHIRMTQDATGSRVMTLPAGKWPARYAAADKLLSTGANKVDLLIVKNDGTNLWYQLDKDWA